VHGCRDEQSTSESHNAHIVKHSYQPAAGAERNETATKEEQAQADPDMPHDPLVNEPCWGDLPVFRWFAKRVKTEESAGKLHHWKLPIELFLSEVAHSVSSGPTILRLRHAPEADIDETKEQDHNCDIFHPIHLESER